MLLTGVAATSSMASLFSVAVPETDTSIGRGSTVFALVTEILRDSSYKADSAPFHTRTVHLRVTVEPGRHPAFRAMEFNVDEDTVTFGLAPLFALRITYSGFEKSPVSVSKTTSYTTNPSPDDFHSRMTSLPVDRSTVYLSLGK